MEKIRTDNIEIYVYQQAKFGNTESGDVYSIHMEDDEYCLFAIADGLGSGPVARQSAEIITEVLKEYHHESLDELLSRCNDYMMQKRGAAVGIVKVDYRRKKVQYSCVGNVRFYMLHGGQKMIYPLPVMGYLSGRPHKLNTQEYSYQSGDVFILHSDGVVVSSPKLLLKENSCPNAIYETVVKTIKQDDDATFITGGLLH